MHSIVVLFLYIVYAVIHTVIKTIDQQSLVFVYYIKPSFCWYVVNKSTKETVYRQDWQWTRPRRPQVSGK